MKNLIVTADDYGVFPAINEGIIEAVNAGVVDSVAAFSNYKGEVISAAAPGTRYNDSLTNIKWLLNHTKENPPEIGCHVTVTSGKPLTGEKMAFACDNNGNFYEFRNFRNFSEKQQLKNLYDELCAQIEELQSVCTVKHVTNHHNSLTLFRHHFEVYTAVVKKFNLPMRSADVRPLDRQKTYLWVQDRLLTMDISKKDRAKIKEFQGVIAKEFRENKFGVKGPSFLETRHYGPLGLIPLARLREEKTVDKKHELLKEFYEELATSVDDRSVELLMHIAKAEGAVVERSHDLDYSGVDRNYFDSRAIELESIIRMKKKFPSWTNVERKGWSVL